jgi:predicted dehydrogenase
MYRAAVIGLGRMGSTFDDEIQRGGAIFLPYCHAPSYMASPHTELVAGADLHEGQGAIFAERWGLSGEHIYSDYRDMLAAERPDIVSVCTTARHRAAIMQDAIEAGVKAIWAEKPITLSLADADAVIDLSTRNGVVIAINCSRRHSPFLTEARRMVLDGELGEILQITAYAECHISQRRLVEEGELGQRQPCHRHDSLSCRRRRRMGLRRDGIGRAGRR